MIRLIKLSSIKHNPHTGRQVYLEPGQSTREETWKKGKLVKVVEERPVQVIHSMTPEPSFLFTYESLEVECGGCHARFDFSSLGSDSMDTGDDDVYSDTVCPECGLFECLDGIMKIETIKQALKRLKTTDSGAYRRLREK